MNQIRWQDETGTGASGTSIGSAGARYRAKLALYPERRAQSSVARVAREIVRALLGSPAPVASPNREDTGPRGRAEDARPLSARRAERN